MADAHFYIDKYIQNNHTITRIKQLSAGEQLNEIARMASGIDVTPASLDNAMEMINNARLKKNQLKKN
jgi:DNA repair protein RecN (Recombination protein N)